MAQVIRQLPEYDVSYDCSLNPEILLMMAEQDDAMCDETESQWRAGQAITQPKHSTYDN